MTETTPAPTLPVSVVIPAHNREQLIGRAVDSAFAQRPARPVEVIVVDDNSSDATAEVARRHGAKVVRHDRNRGPGAARNTGWRAATQPWIGMLDSDDEWRPHLLQTLWPWTTGTYVLVGGACLTHTSDGSEDYYAGTPRRRGEVLRSPAALIAYGNFVGPSGTLVRRDALEAIGGSREDMPLGTGQDMDLFVRLLEHGPGYLTSEVVTLYHLDGGGAAAVQRNRELMRDAHMRQAAWHEGKPWWSPWLLGRAHGVDLFDRGRQAWREGRRREAWAHALRIATRPSRLSGATGLVVRRRIAVRRYKRLTA